MKLKKIASLMLAGIMAVSMLAGCKDAASSTPTEPVEPVDNSFAAAINDKLSDSEKAIVSFESDNALVSALTATADKLGDSVLAGNTISWLIGEDVENFREMMDAVPTNGIGDEFRIANTSDTTAASILVVPGNYTEDGMTKEVVDMLKAQINTGIMPNQSSGGNYKYEYAGKIAVVKVNSLDGNNSAYVIGVVVDQTVTETKV